MPIIYKIDYFTGGGVTEVGELQAGCGTYTHTPRAPSHSPPIAHQTNIAQICARLSISTVTPHANRGHFSLAPRNGLLHFLASLRCSPSNLWKVQIAPCQKFPVTCCCPRENPHNPSHGLPDCSCSLVSHLLPRLSPHFHHAALLHSPNTTSPSHAKVLATLFSPLEALLLPLLLTLTHSLLSVEKETLLGEVIFGP